MTSAFLRLPDPSIVGGQAPPSASWTRTWAAQEKIDQLTSLACFKGAQSTPTASLFALQLKGRCILTRMKRFEEGYISTAVMTK